MICTTTSTLDNGVITEYKGIVSGEVVTGINFVKDFGASIRNIVGGRSEGYEEEFVKARNQALDEMQIRASKMGANAVVGVDIDYEILGQGNNMLMVSATGTAVVVRDKN